MWAFRGRYFLLLSALYFTYWYRRDTPVSFFCACVSRVLLCEYPSIVDLHVVFFLLPRLNITTVVNLCFVTHTPHDDVSKYHLVISPGHYIKIIYQNSFHEFFFFCGILFAIFLRSRQRVTKIRRSTPGL